MSASTSSTADVKKQCHGGKPSGWETAKPFESLPGPKPLPLIGNTWRFLPKIGDFYGKDLADIHKDLYKQYGEISILKGFWSSPVVLLFNPTDFETLLRSESICPIRTSFPSLDYYREYTQNICPNFGLVSSHGEEWSRNRAVVNPILMHSGNVLQYTDKMNIVADELIDNITYLSQQNEDGEMPNDFLHELYKWALESISVVTLDTHLGCLKRNLEPDSEPQKMINNLKQVFSLMYQLDVLSSMWKNINTRNWKLYVEALDFLVRTNMKYIYQARNKMKKDVNAKNETKTMLQQLLREDYELAVAMSIDMLITGVNTTGRILGAALYYLAKNPEQQEKLRKEAKYLLPDKDTPLTKEILSETVYVKAVIKEVMRLAPVAVGIVRTTTKNLVLAGYQIPKGTDVMTSNLILSSMDEHFPRAKEFLPERWLFTAPPKLSHKSANPFIFAPFGYAPRGCVGKKLANLELEVALLKIVRNFELEWPHEDMTFNTTTLYGIAKPLKVRVKPVDECRDVYY